MEKTTLVVIRQFFGLSQKDLCERLNIGERTYRRIETEKDLTTVQKLALSQVIAAELMENL